MHLPLLQRARFQDVRDVRVRPLLALLLLLALVAGPLAIAPSADAATKKPLDIVKIVYDPAGRDTWKNGHLNKEYIVLKNTGKKTLSLTGYTLRDNGPQRYRASPRARRSSPARPSPSARARAGTPPRPSTGARRATSGTTPSTPPGRTTPRAPSSSPARTRRPPRRRRRSTCAPPPRPRTADAPRRLIGACTWSAPRLIGPCASSLRAGADQAAG